jgi:hypothetical protein
MDVRFERLERLLTCSDLLQFEQRAFRSLLDAVAVLNDPSGDAAAEPADDDLGGDGTGDELAWMQGMFDNPSGPAASSDAGTCELSPFFGTCTFQNEGRCCPDL